MLSLLRVQGSILSKGTKIPQAEQPDQKKKKKKNKTLKPQKTASPWGVGRKAPAQTSGQSGETHRTDSDALVRGKWLTA